MTYKEATICGFVDELESIQKEAGITTLLRGFKGFAPAVKGLFTTGGKGLQNIGRAISGKATLRSGAVRQLTGPKGWHLARAGLKQVAPAAGIVGAGGLAAYGAGKAAFGR